MMTLVICISISLLFISVWRYCRKPKTGSRNEFSRLPAKLWEFSRIILIVLIFLLGGLAWSRVVFHQTEVYPEKEGAIVCFVLDITASTQAALKKGGHLSRMDAMVMVVEDVIEFFEMQKDQDNRITIVAFGWDAWKLILYPTDDFRLLRREILSRINWRVSLEYGRDGSNLGAALIEGALSFPIDKPGTKPKKKILIAITDGEPYGDQTKIHENISAGLANYGQLADISFYLVPIGDPQEEVPIPKFDWKGNIVGMERDSNGQLITTKTDVEFLEEIAEKTDGVVIKGGLESVGKLKHEIKEAISNARKTGRMVEKPTEKDLSFWLVIAYVLVLVLFFFKFRN